MSRSRTGVALRALARRAMPRTTRWLQTSRRLQARTRRLDQYGSREVGFTKIDVEGHEEQVLAGAIETIERSRPTLLIEIEERHNPGGLGRIVALMSSQGYDGFFYAGGARMPVSSFEPKRHQRVSDALAAAGRDRRALPYVNNFPFRPRASAVEPR